MATTTRTIRAQSALWALLDTEAERRGVSPNALAAELLQAALAPVEAEERPGAPVYREPTPRAQAAREAAKAAEAKTGVAVTSGRSRAQAAMDAAGTAVWDVNAKRQPYQKGQRPGAKGKR